MNIRKDALAARANLIGTAAPSLTDRFSQAQAAVGAHPLTPPQAPVSTDTPSPAADDAEGKGRPRRVSVPLDQIDETRRNARRIYRPERVHEIAASIAKNGQDTPGFATLRDGRYLLAAGGYRIRGLRVLNAKTMELLVWDNLTDRELYELSFRENHEREGQSPLDNALAWQDLLDDGVYANETEIAHATGFSLSNVNKTMSSLKLSQGLRNLVEEDPESFKLSVLYQLYLYEQVAGPDKAVALGRQVLEGAIGRQQIEDARKQLAEPTQRKAKEQSRQYKIDAPGVNSGVIKEWDSGKISVELTTADPAKRAELVEQIKKLFK